MNDEEKDALRGVLERMPDSVLDATLQHCERLLRDMKDTNSSFPATQEFLKARGITHVQQLDKAGREELRMFLERVKSRLEHARN